ncbi:poly(3-hydroxybutyrate) depolymerase [Paraburkholderia steynii]|uniref:Poly(3-hydroxybutyrate) depolymerase n=1 Tax=Paraburkholderia steynii TaxID=1245441 RepID=A0A7Z7FJG5_9BURK|nr:polyhydroxyalkanoate depolymerase [Paraburkholderia steynii]SDI57612.1 poly(3-hydroxybutyrate) depolymerase [Paraburkholderia steynii]
MLYELHEWQRAAWAPFLPWLQITANFLTHTGTPLHSTPSRQFAAGCDLLVRLHKRYAKPKFGLTETVVAGQPVAVNEAVALEKPFCRLVHFKRAATCQQPVVLLVAPLSGHHASLLRDTVRAMLPDFDVYITDWLDARQIPLSDGTFHLDDYVAYVREFIDFLGPEVHVVAVCQSTVPVLAAVALAAGDGQPTPVSVTLMGGPVDARRNPTVVNKLAVEKPLDWFTRTLINTVPRPYAGAGRRVYPGFRQHLAFMAMNPDRHLKAHVDYYFDVSAGNAEASVKHRRFYDEYNAVLDMTADYYLETVRVVFQEFCLARGTWQVDGEPVRPDAIRGSALITVEGERDDICGPGQTHAAQDLCTSVDAARKHCITVAECGHYGIFSGSSWRTQIYPQIRNLINRYHVESSSYAQAAMRTANSSDVESFHSVASP